MSFKRDPFPQAHKLSDLRNHERATYFHHAEHASNERKKRKEQSPAREHSARAAYFAHKASRPENMDEQTSTPPLYSIGHAVVGVLLVRFIALSNARSD